MMPTHYKTLDHGKNCYQHQMNLEKSSIQLSTDIMKSMHCDVQSQGTENNHSSHQIFLLILSHITPLGIFTLIALHWMVMETPNKQLEGGN